VLQSGNMSLGVNILSVLVQKTASLLGNDWDIEITEGHHRNKIDAPSGTALLLGESAAAGRKQSLKDIQRLERVGHTGIRPAGEIGFSVIRAGSIIGDHSVLFAHENEHITLSHQAQNRNIFASGAVFAAKKIVSMPTGFYKMTDVLDLGL
jgi:4-hydroxy-tetrahydrodipicolinate reductase